MSERGGYFIQHDLMMQRACSSRYKRRGHSTESQRPPHLLTRFLAALYLTLPWYVLDVVWVAAGLIDVSLQTSTSGASAQSAFYVSSTEKDPYKYQVGFGNRFASEAMCVLFRAPTWSHTDVASDREPFRTLRTIHKK